MSDKKLPIIGLSPLMDVERDSYWMLPGYMECIMEAGGVPIMLPLTASHDEIDKLVAICDGILFTGGQDVSPVLYNMEEGVPGVETCPVRDDMERVLFSEAMKQGKSIFGICRGLQFINVMFGGTLYRDLNEEHPSDVIHRQKAPYDAPSHEVKVLAGSGLSQALGAETIAVNSCHHQGIKDLAPDLVATAVAPDGLVEAFELPGENFVWAVQWHPEMSHKASEASRKIVKAFVDSCR